MSELIKREDAVKATWHEPSYTDAYNVLTEVRDRIEALPTVDAVQVVRCKDCKWAEVDAWWTYCKLGHKEDTTNSIIYTCTHDFYCADGERRTDGE